MSFSVIVKTREKNAAILELKGRLDTTTSPECESTLQDIVKQQPLALILDMTELEYISSMGLRVILSARKELEAHGKKLLMTHLQPQIQKVFEVAAILPETDVFESVEGADIYLDALQRKEMVKDSDYDQI